MPAKPTENMNRLETTCAGWKANAPAATFYRLTQAQFDAKVERSRDVRRRLAEAQRVVNGLENERNDVDAENLELEGLIAKAVAGDADYGEDSSLYESIGRKRKSERKHPGRRAAKTDGK